MTSCCWTYGRIQISLKVDIKRKLRSGLKHEKSLAKAVISWLHHILLKRNRNHLPSWIRHFELIKWIPIRKQKRVFELINCRTISHSSPIPVIPAEGSNLKHTLLLGICPDLPAPRLHRDQMLAESIGSQSGNQRMKAHFGYCCQVPRNHQKISKFPNEDQEMTLEMGMAPFLMVLLMS